jgi:hypothetical protein
VPHGSAFLILLPGGASKEGMAPNDGSDRTASKDAPRAATSKQPLSPAAERALAEAAARRAQRQKDSAAEPPKEIQGRGGLDPTRYGDWEVNGAASDF